MCFQEMEVLLNRYRFCLKLYIIMIHHIYDYII